MELVVLHEDEWIIALDKPAGMVVHPTYRNTSGTLLNGILWRFRDRPGVQPGILTRLDKGTSGVVLVALTPDLHARLQKQRMQKDLPGRRARNAGAGERHHHPAARARPGGQASRHRDRYGRTGGDAIRRDVGR